MRRVVLQLKYNNNLATRSSSNVSTKFVTRQSWLKQNAFRFYTTETQSTADDDALNRMRRDDDDWYGDGEANQEQEEQPTTTTTSTQENEGQQQKKKPKKHRYSRLNPLLTNVIGPDHHFTAKFTPSPRMSESEKLNTLAKYKEYARPVNTLIPRRTDVIRCIEQDTQIDHGNLSRYHALTLAKEKELDLILLEQHGEFAAFAKLMNYEQYLEERILKKEEVKEKQKENESKMKIKKIRMKGNTEDHAIQLKCEQIQAFLEDGKNVQVTVIAREPREGEIIFDKVKKTLTKQPALKATLHMDPITYATNQMVTMLRLKKK